MTALELFVDTATEWRGLATLLEEKNVEWMNRVSPGLFTGDRVNVFHAMQDAYVKHGEITYEGIKVNNNGVVPGQLTAAQGGNIRAIVEELARLARKRQAYRVSTAMKELAQSADPTMAEIHQALLFDPILAEEDSSLAPGAQELLSDLHLKQTGEYKYARSGLRVIDGSLGGEWKPRAAVIVAASPGSGKTTLVAQSMIRMARGYTNETTGEIIVTPSLFFSLEMAKSDLLIKWLGDELTIDTALIQSGKLTKDQFTRIERQTVDIQSLPMYVIDNGALTLGQMVYEIKKHINQHDVRVVFVDYLQIVNHAPTGNRNADLGDFVLALKALAKREGITVVILSQVTEGNEGAFITRDSGNVGAVVDAMFYLTLDDGDGFGSPVRNVTMERRKNRFGPTGKVPLMFNGPYQRFEEATQ
jgi:replicative DNA helicase